MAKVFIWIVLEATKTDYLFLLAPATPEFRVTFFLDKTSSEISDSFSVMLDGGSKIVILLKVNNNVCVNFSLRFIVLFKINLKVKLLRVCDNI